MRSLTTFSIWFCFLHLKSCCGDPLTRNSLFGETQTPRLISLDVKCERTGMTVFVNFDLPFHGVIYSRGHFYEPSCNYIKEKGAGQRSYKFLIPIHSCGTSGNLDDSLAEGGLYFENTIVVQNDPLIQEIWDQARRLRCTWQRIVSKTVTASPFSVEDPEMVSLQFDSRTINTLMQIQRGSSPFSSPATGYISLGEDASIVIYVQESGQNLDANVVSCKASSTQGDSVPLVDANGCLLRPELLSQFHKLKNPNDIEADLMFVSYLKGFRIGESMDFIVSCKLEVCEGSCLEPCALGPLQKRRKREAPRIEESQSGSKKLLDLQREVIVISKINEYEHRKNCMPNEFTTAIMIVFMVLFAALTGLIFYLALHLYSTQRTGQD